MNIKNLSFSYGLQEIFSDVSIHINELSKVGIVGVNGAGKSTLFKLILGELTPDSGKIFLKNKDQVGFLPQVISDDLSDENISVLDYLLEGRPIKKLEQDLSDTYLKVSLESDEKKQKILFNKIDKLQAKLEYYEAYNAENILLKIVDGINISNELLDMKIKDLSGGQKSKIAFARILYANPEVLLLDEPTNHLDQESKDYIIKYLKNYRGTVLVISHDIDFLNEVTDSILYIDKLTHSMELFPGNYEKYMKIRKERLKTKERIYERQSEEEEKLKKIIRKYIGGNEKKAKIAKDRIKKLERLQAEKVTLEKKQKTAHFKVTINKQSGIVPISVEGLSFGYPKASLLYEDLTFDLARGEKFLIVGENGVGKSTLLKLIMGILSPLKGSINIGKETTIAYYAQEHETLNLDKNILDNFQNTNLSVRELRSFLGSFLFSGDDVYKLVKNLSPGERSRVALAKLALTGANVLILDEPTNHLDPETEHIIADVFKSYEGTMLIVSHNSEFVDNLGVERMLLLPKGEIKYYDKNTVDYYENLNNEHSYK